ncbi:hypothetical protein KFE25_011519 [Diacronema lutheri]|uniref:Uncharacterized protein n=1 Tax=Diacronema lutheri TaxID=2081491 RepID=A0A8J6C6M8_DIALT|nr:hypothetical protein KFE25_011519 [Diacronema lutheri]
MEGGFEAYARNETKNVIMFDTTPEAVLELLAAAATVREQLALAFAPSGGARGDALDAKRAPFEVLRSLLVRVARPSDVRARLRLRQLLLALRDPRRAAERSRRRTDELRDARRVAERLVAELHVALPDLPLFSGVCAGEDGSAAAPFTMLRVAPRPGQRGAPGVRGVAQLLGEVRLERAPRALLVAIDRPSADKEPVELGGPGGGGGGALVLRTVGGSDATFALASVLVQRRGRKRDACAVLAPAPDGGWWRVDGGGKQRDNAGSAAAEVRELAVVALYERVEPHAPTRRVADAADEARLCAVARALDAGGEHVWRWATDTAPPLRDALAVLRGGADAPLACAALAAAELAPLFARAHVDGAWAARDGDAALADARSAAAADGVRKRTRRSTPSLPSRLVVALRECTGGRVVALLVVPPPRAAGAVAKPLLVAPRVGGDDDWRIARAHVSELRHAELLSAEPTDVAIGGDARAQPHVLALELALLARAVVCHDLGDAWARCKSPDEMCRSANAHIAGQAHDQLLPDAG